MADSHRHPPKQRRSIQTAAVALSLGLITSSFGQGNRAGTNGLEVALITGKPTYRAGEPITIILRVTTVASEDVRLQFVSSQRYDFIIRDAGGTPVWRWSEGQAFLQVLGVERLGPGRPSITYQAEYGGNLAPGRYSVEGTIVARNRLLSATLVIQIQ
jgi:hypothetical protein